MSEVLACLQSLALDDNAQMKLDSQVADTGYTVSKVVSMVSGDSKFIKLSKEQKLVTTRDISDGNGYCSRVFKTVLHFDKEDTFKFIMKIPTDAAWGKLHSEKPLSEEEKKKNWEQLIQMHNGEVDAYELLVGMTEPFPFPKIYHMERIDDKSVGIIAMEDLSDQGASLGIFYSVTPQQCYNVARHMADLQCYYELDADEEWKTKFSRNMHIREDMETIWKRTMFPALKYPDDELVAKVQMFVDMDIQKLSKFTVEDYSAQFGRKKCNTIAHSDLWTNNMLIKMNENDSVSDEILAFIDWQTCSISSPCFDIARFISNCTDAETRRPCERKAVDVYYDRLTENYAKRGQKPKFTREQAYEFYDLSFVQEVALLCIMFGIMAMPLVGSKEKSDQEKVEKLALRLKMAANDAMPIIEKYQMRSRFAVTRSDE
ncbi:hypothetical protein M3Y98_01189600 [Aphelenchoides besseyi]|nr:hypothetical protein M3Y98_01189600 [Aphelenchoides besseyi]KAI6195036.1 hypothetical protein M3Y96_01188500 [Aphelenchoides besseyi]